jgi:hypothetical protein
MFPWRKRPPAPPPSPWQQLREVATGQRRLGDVNLLDLLRHPLTGRAIQLIGLRKVSTGHNNPAVPDALEAILPLLAIRRTAQDISQLRPYWSYVLPLLAWVGYRTYRRERKQVQIEKTLAALAAQERARLERQKALAQLRELLAEEAQAEHSR